MKNERSLERYSVEKAIAGSAAVCGVWSAHGAASVEGIRSLLHERPTGKEVFHTMIG
jgi:hypothetical protein